MMVQSQGESNPCVESYTEDAMPTSLNLLSEGCAHLTWCSIPLNSSHTHEIWDVDTHSFLSRPYPFTYSRLE